MGFMEAIKTCFSRYVTFSGRARRSEFWWFMLAVLVGSFVFGFLDGMLFGTGPESGGILGMIFSLAVLLPSIAVTVRRLHDTGRTGWWYLIAFIPLIGLIVLIVFTVKDGEPGTNRFGPNPKGVGDADVFA